MLLETIFGYKSTWRIIELLAEAPAKSLTRQEIREMTKLGNVSVSLALKKLVLAGVVIKERTLGGRVGYYLDNSYIFVNQILNLIKEERKYLRHISYTNLIAICEFARKVLDRVNVKQLILFGSVAKHTATRASDIDIAVIGEHDVKKEIIINEIVEVIEKIHKKHIQVHYFAANEFKKDKGIMRDGIKLI